jgi:plastocyanin
MYRKIAIGSGVLLLLLSGLAMILPAASAASTTMVTIPPGSSVGQSAFPAYSPANMTVVIGVNNTVTWTNNDTAIHTVYSTSVPATASAFQSPLINPGSTYTYTFTVPGVYQYHCNLHPLWMQGSVTVKAAVNPAPEFPLASLAVILFAVIAAAILVAPRLRQTPSMGPATSNGPAV